MQMVAGDGEKAPTEWRVGSYSVRGWIINILPLWEIESVPTTKLLLAKKAATGKEWAWLCANKPFLMRQVDLTPGPSVATTP